MKFIRFLPLAALLIGMAACIEDTIQINDISKDIAVERQQSLPLIKASLTFDDIAGSYDSLMVMSGDTIYLYLNEDLSFEDTMKMTEVGENIEFDFLNIHYEVIPNRSLCADFLIRFITKSKCRYNLVQ